MRAAARPSSASRCGTRRRPRAPRAEPPDDRLRPAAVTARGVFGHHHQAGIGGAGKAAASASCGSRTPHTLTRPKASARAACAGRDARISAVPTRKASANGASRSTSARSAMPDSGDDQAIARHQRREPLGGREVDVEVPQVAIVDADDRRAERHRAAHLGRVMRLDQHVHAEPPRLVEDRRRFRIVEQRQDRQHRVGAVQARLRHLARVDDEVLGEDRAGKDAAHRREIVERAAEEVGPSVSTLTATAAPA